MKKIALILALIVIVTCLVLITGSTFSLFGSESKGDISVSTGKVDVVATVDEASLKTWSYGQTEADATNGTFANAGSYARYIAADNKLELVNLVAGDNAKITINVTNNSTISIAYRLKIVANGDLWDKLDTSITVNGEEIKFMNGASEWCYTTNPLEAIAPIVIALGVPEDSNAQDLECSLSFALEAIQGNADVKDPYTYEEATKTYVINNAEGMLCIEELVNSIPHGEGVALNIALGADIDMTGVEWTPADFLFVNLDGRNHTISNLTCGADSWGRSGLIGYFGGGYIKNLTLKNITTEGTQTGILVGAIEGALIENVTIDGNNTVNYNVDKNTEETWGGAGVIAGVAQGVNASSNIVIADGANVTVNYASLTTEAPAQNEYAFISDISAVVTCNGTVTTSGSFSSMKEIDGVSYVTDETGDFALYVVPAEYAEETLVVPEGVETIGGWSFSYNSNVKTVVLPDSVTRIARKAFDNSSVEKIVLNEGLVEIEKEAFSKAYNLKEINFPSTLTTIGYQAFRLAGFETLTIPASVTEIAEGAFRDIPGLKTVIIEGNPTIANFAFRSCANLENVYLLGDNVTFSGTGIAFSKNDAGNANAGAINVYVSNEVVKNNLLAATAYDPALNITVLSENTELASGLAKAPDSNTYYVSSADGFAALNEMMVNGTAGKSAVINILSDIDFAGHIWTTVDSFEDGSFTLSALNGLGHTISNLTVSGNAMFSRFAGHGDVAIKDLTFANASVNYSSINTAIIAGHSYQNVLLDNVDVYNSTVIGGYKVAIYIGTEYNENPNTTVTATLKNCDIANCTVTTTAYDFGTCGFIGFVYEGDLDAAVFENCTISDTTLSTTSPYYDLHAFLYYVDSGECINEADGVVVTNCTFVKNA